MTNQIEANEHGIHFSVIRHADGRTFFDTESRPPTAKYGPEFIVTEEQRRRLLAALDETK